MMFHIQNERVIPAGIHFVENT